MIPIEKNKEYTIEITAVSSDGNGVGHIDGYAVFVPQTVRGDFVTAEIVKVKSRYANGTLKNIITPSPKRSIPPCGIYEKCGGCQLMHMDYEEQLFEKENIVKNSLMRIGGFSGFEFENICPMEKPERYRNKMVFPVGEDKNGNPVCGFYAPKSHDVIPAEDCMTGCSENKEIIQAVMKYMKENGVCAYNEKSGKGSIRGIFTRKSFATGEIMVVIVTSGDQLIKSDRLVEGLSAVKGVSSVILNVNKKRTNLALGDKNIVLYGTDTITDTICGIEFKISPHSFFQINPVMTEKLYSKVMEYADLSGNESVMDIYCGIGTISLCAAKSAKEVVGIEIVEQAIEDAKVNAEINGIKNVRFFADCAENIVPQLVKNDEKPDVVILDPPRKGSDEKTLSAIAKAQPSKIVYVSCNPATLARDLKFLAQNGYELKKAQPFDMFPHTMHVESVVLMSRVDK